jgi:hypothetical protein
MVVHDQASFAAALAAARPGDTISLSDGVYPSLQVRGRVFAERVRIVGSRNAKVAGITFSGARNLSLEGVTVTPPGDARALILIENGSSEIVLDRVLVDGRVESAGAGIKADESSTEITIQNSELTNCGAGDRCLSPGARGLRILNNTFHDCRSCDFIRGGGAGALVQANSFERAQPGSCEEAGKVCPHNDHIQIMGGGPWTLVGNRFGPRRLGAASIYVNTGIGNVDNPIHDVEIVSNLFTGDSGTYAVRLGTGGGQPAGTPERISVVNNTILSGSVTAVFLTEGWAGVPPEKRPLLANNIFGVQGAGGCDSGRFIANLALTGPSCSGDERGPAHLDAGYQPTAESTLVLDRADPAFASPTDIMGRGRVGLPDRGAFEFERPLGQPEKPAATPEPAAPNEPAPAPNPEAPNEPVPPPNPAAPNEPVPPLDTPKDSDAPASPRQPKTPRLAIARLASAPSGPRAGARFWVRFTIVRRDTNAPLRPGKVACSARVGSRALEPVAKGLRGAVAVCAWHVPLRTRGKALRATIVARNRGSTASRTLVRRIRQRRAANGQLARVLRRLAKESLLKSESL